MSDEPGKSFLSTIPLPGLIAVLTGVIGTVLLQYEPLNPRRPVDPIRPNPVSIEPYQIESTAYEDPLNVVARTDFQEQGKSPDPKDNKPKRTLHRPETVLRKNDRSLLILPVFMKPGVDRVSTESRARTRLAVIEGLASSGYVSDSYKIECCRLPEWRGDDQELLIPDGLLLPFERFERGVRIPHIDENYGSERSEAQENVIVLWLPGDSMDSRPIIKLRRILKLLLPVSTPWKSGYSTDPTEVTALGPHSTGTLVNMAEEARKWPGTSPLLWDHPIKLFSPSATAPDNYILEEANGEEGVPLVPSLSLKQTLHASLNGPDFFRTIKTDDIIATALVDELELRGVKVRDKDSDHIVIVSEFNTPYGRSFPSLFLTAADKAPNTTPFNQKNSKWHWFTFPRGLDGRSTGTAAASESSQAAKPKTDGSSERTYTPGDIPDGPNQADALRRMAEELRQLDKRLAVGPDKDGIKAIGLMGGDAFDKLWLLRALKPHFPQAIFFTDNLDAWFWQREEIRSTRNLVIASPYGLSLKSDLQMGKPPFRDSYQTSVYASTLAATGAIRSSSLENMTSSDVRLYEIGSKGPHDISRSDGDIHPPAEAKVSSKRLSRLLGILTLIALGALIYWAIPEIGRMIGLQEKPPKPDPLQPPTGSVFGIKDSVIYYVTHPYLWIFPILILSLLITVILWKLPEYQFEPFHLWTGVSAWPAQGFRIAAILLAFHLTANLLKTLKINVRNLDKEFFARKKRSRKFYLTPRFPISLPKVWFWCVDAPDPGSKPVNPNVLWRKYRRYTGYTARLLRTTSIFLMFLLAYGLFRWQFERDVPPVRGETTLQLNGILNFLSVVAFLWITALVIDAMWAGRMFVHWMTRGTTDWQTPRLQKYLDAGISPPAACDYLDLQVIAGRTRAIVSFAFYPFYILTLLILSRLELFDHWLWPKGVIAIYSIPILLVVIAAQLLRSEAEGVRTSLLGLLHADRGFPPSEKSPVNCLIDEVKNLKSGALAPISEQPVMRGIYWLLSALGIGSLWQYLSLAF